MTDLGPGAEFDLIRAIAERLGDAAAGIGDDAAVFRVPRGERLVASTDSAVEGVHFRREWLSLQDIGYRAVAAALSDLAAMAAAPLGVLVAITIAPDEQRETRDDLLALADGIGDAARAAGTLVVGGNLARADALTITSTVFGSAFAPLLRGASRAAGERKGERQARGEEQGPRVRPGDLLYVTGALGGPHAAVRALREGRAPPPAVMDRFARPSPRLAEARWLASRGATACIDISDGLAGDAAHLAAASGVGFEIQADRVPVFAGASSDDALAGGEEYELLVAARAPFDEPDFAAAFGIPLTLIGRAGGAGGAAVVAFTRDGERVAAPRGYDHFSS